MPRYRAMVSVFKSTELAIDHIVNTVYFDDQGELTDADGLAEDIATLFATYRTYPGGWNRVNCRMYDMAEPAPREIQGEFTAQMTPGGNPTGPREVALCLSFHTERNLPRQRGRIYIGPWNTGQVTERPGADSIASLTTLSQGLADIGGTDVTWCVFSPTTPPPISDQFKQIEGGWVDDEWDTQRSRGLRATARNAWTREG